MNEIHTNVNSSDSINIKAGTITNVIVHTESEGAVVASLRITRFGYTYRGFGEW
jgi:hypothetical protein